MAITWQSGLHWPHRHVCLAQQHGLDRLALFVLGELHQALRTGRVKVRVRVRVRVRVKVRVRLRVRVGVRVRVRFGLSSGSGSGLGLG